jgi:hypothetical protein
MQDDGHLASDRDARENGGGKVSHGSGGIVPLAAE